jgi:hypothetical protein
MLDLAESLGGTLSIRQSRAGGVLVRLGPLSLPGVGRSQPADTAPGIIG